MELTPSQISEEFEDSLTEEILLALFLLRSRTDSALLKISYESGDPQQVVDSIDWDSFREDLSAIVAILLMAYSKGSISATKETLNSFKGGRLDLTGDIAKRFIQAINDMINELIEATKRGFTFAVERLMDEASSKNTAIPLLILLLGLTVNSVLSVMNVRQAQLKNGNRVKQVKEASIKQSEKALLNRATLISETEAYSSVSQGRTDTWEQWATAGYITIDSLKQWVTKADEFVCEVCGPLHLVTTIVGTPYPGGLYSTPAHPRCRCHERLL
jgi:hypothetical protein